MRILFKVLIICGLILVAISGFAYTYFWGTENWNQNQLQKINKNQSEYSFVVYGDNRNSSGRFDQLILRVNQENVQFSIDNGDLVYNGGSDELKSFLGQIKRSNNPVLTNIGNHDLHYGNKYNYYKVFGDSYYSFATKNSYFIFLDDSNGVEVDGKQMDWLQNELNKSQQYKHCFVFMHKPLFDPRTNQSEGLKNTENAKKLNDLFDKYNVTMLFGSHLHGYYRGIWGKTPYIITGGAGAPLKGLDSQNEFYHFILVNVSDNNVNYQLIKI